MIMRQPSAWIICEATGNWTAALRVAIGKWQAARAVRLVAPRIQETRQLTELEAAIKENRGTVGFVEVCNNNLAAMLDLLDEHARRNVLLIALLGSDLGQQNEAETSHRERRNFAADALTEAGALSVVSAPRHMGSAVEIASQYCKIRPQTASVPNGMPTIAELAWGALPWQDA